MSERAEPAEAVADEPPTGGIPAALRRAAGVLRYSLSRRLDAKPEQLIADAIRDAARRGRAPVCLAVSYAAAAGELAELARNRTVNGLVTKTTVDGLRALQRELPGLNLGGYWGRAGWVLPVGAIHVYFVGSWRLLTLAMLRQALRSQVVTLSARCGRQWIDVPLDGIRRAAAGRASLRRFWRRCRERLGIAAPAPEGFAKPLPMLNAATLSRLIEDARGEGAADFVPGRVVLACGNLAPGGAERQAAYTAAGLAEAASVESVQLLCDMLIAGHPGRYDFYLPLLERAGVPARMPERYALTREMVTQPAALARVQADFPEGLLLDIANLYREFVRLRPEVVHAWLDWSNTRAGLAAALAGVPRILLSGRNLNPTHFSLYQPYMDPIYRALAALPNVVLLNNSRAGADSYAEWLGLPPERIEVIHNALDMQPVAADAGHAARARLGIPAGAPVVGGVFRFYPEKRPLLWVEAAAIIARRCPDAWFVMVGQGVLQADIESAARSLGIAHRLLMPGVIADILPLMQAFDVFLLTSYGEGLPNVVLEAQWVGAPVVATRAGGVAEALEPGVSGWIVDPPDAAALAERVCLLLREPQTRARAGAAGPALVRERFGMQRMIDETLQAYGLAPAGAEAATSRYSLS